MAQNDDDHANATKREEGSGTLTVKTESTDEETVLGQTDMKVEEITQSPPESVESEEEEEEEEGTEDSEEATSPDGDSQEEESEEEHLPAEHEIPHDHAAQMVAVLEVLEEITRGNAGLWDSSGAHAGLTDLYGGVGEEEEVKEEGDEGEVKVKVEDDSSDAGDQAVEMEGGKIKREDGE